jgi:hypothetical protein
VPIPGYVDQNNYAQQYDQVKDKPGSYTLDGYISDSDAQAFFK